jgi:serine/threonine protein kinase
MTDWSDLEVEGTLDVGPVTYHGTFMDCHSGFLSLDDDRPSRVSIRILRCFRMKAHYMTDPAEETAVILQRVTCDVRRWKSLCHQNILPVLGMKLDEDNEPCLLSPLIPRGNLTFVLRFEPDTEKLLKVLEQAAHGLEYLHSQNPPISHGSLDPDDIFVADDGFVKISGFGLKPLCEYITEGMTLTTSPGKEGGYIQAPEVLAPDEDSEKYTTASDVYDFGSMIIDVLSGKRPYHGIPHYRAILATMKHELPSHVQHPALSAEDPIWNLVYKCWAFEPSERPNIRYVADELETKRLSIPLS